MYVVPHSVYAVQRQDEVVNSKHFYVVYVSILLEVQCITFGLIINV